MASSALSSTTAIAAPQLSGSAVQRQINRNLKDKFKNTIHQQHYHHFQHSYQTPSLSSSNVSAVSSGSSLKSASSRNVLHQSILDGRLKQLNYFLKMGYNVDTKDKYGRTCLMLACLSDHEDYGLQVAKLLLRNNANINTKDSLGRSCVYLACSQQRLKLFNYFIDNYSAIIDFRQKDNEGNTLLNYLAVHGDVHMLKRVIKKMNERRIELDNRNTAGYSALLLAIKHDRYLNAFELVKDGLSSPYIKDYDDTCMNAIEWLLFRVKQNKNSILNNKLNTDNLAENKQQSASFANDQQQQQYRCFDGMDSKLSFQSQRTSTSSFLSDKRLNTNSSANSSYQNANQIMNNPKIVAHNPSNDINYKTWYNTQNQYYLNNNPCDHKTNPNFSTDHHKSRYVPLILTPRRVYYHLKNKSNNQINSLTNIHQSSLSAVNNSLSMNIKSIESFNSENFKVNDKSTTIAGSNEVNENTTQKELVQKLYEKIFTIMSEKAKVKVKTQQELHKEQMEAIAQAEALAKAVVASPPVIVTSSKNPTKSHSNTHKSKRSTSNDHAANNNTPTPVQPTFREKYREVFKIDEKYRIDTNVFNLESMRHTPKLLALQPVSAKKSTSSKEAIHKFYSMYYNEFMPESDDEAATFNSIRFEQFDNMPRLYKSTTATSLFKKEKSSLSNVSTAKSSKNMSAGNINANNINRVKFNFEY